MTRCRPAAQRAWDVRTVARHGMQGHHRQVIRNVTLHFNGRLPLVADLRAVPGATDQSVLATNVRSRDGKRPSFADASDSWFVIPLREVLVIELPAAALEAAEETLASPPPPVRSKGRQAAAEPALELESGEDLGALEPDEALLARIREL
jgi:hypothetical protein